MKGAPGGFTIIEVMIVLAISGLMLSSAIVVFSGRRESTDFSQSVLDVRSHIQSVANGVSSLAVPGLQQYVCSPANIGGLGIMRPVLSSGSSTGQDCIYLGQALQVTPDSTTISAYPIFGLRTIYNGISDSGVASATIADAHPEPAVDSAAPANPAKLLLVNDYSILNGLQVLSATYSGSENDILTIYTSLQDSNTSGNEISLASFGYTGASTDPKTILKQCIEANGCPADGNSVTTTAWKLCLTDTRRQALITVKGSPTGIATTVNMAGCS
jgi:prepilin-type N-terminal cleavage/methylation domain-containing protein